MAGDGLKKFKTPKKGIEKMHPCLYFFLRKKMLHFDVLSLVKYLKKCYRQHVLIEKYLKENISASS